MDLMREVQQKTKKYLKKNNIYIYMSKSHQIWLWMSDNDWRYNL